MTNNQIKPNNDMEANLDITQMSELSDQDFKITVTHMFKKIAKKQKKRQKDEKVSPLIYKKDQ